MTAEIALLNKHGVALAADSAVTFSTIKGQKVYNAGNKLFTLSKCQPIGIMVYGNAEYMGVPWETIVKIYREQLGNRCFDRTAEYFDDFIRFLGSDDELFGADAQEDYVLQRVMLEFMRVRKLIDDKWEAILATQGQIADVAARKIAREEIRNHLRKLSPRSYATGLDANSDQEMASRYSNVFNQARDVVFQQLPLTKVAVGHLMEIAAAALTRDRFSPGTSGVVIAGFGRREHFPSLCAATVEGRVAGRLRYKTDENKAHAVGRGNFTAAIVPFAQTDQVMSFVEGIDPTYGTIVNKLVRGALHELPKRILGQLGALEETVRARLLQEWQGVADELFGDLIRQAEKERRDRHVNPLLEVIDALPKDDLAAVAESLVSITSLKRKVSMEAETVGGPIDVAVISKGDGFVWIRRKHYFRPELNPHFTHNYFHSLENNAHASDGA